MYPVILSLFPATLQWFFLLATWLHCEHFASFERSKQLPLFRVSELFSTTRIILFYSITFIPLHSIFLHSIPFYSNLFYFIPLYPILFHSILCYSIIFHFIPFCSTFIPFCFILFHSTFFHTLLFYSTPSILLHSIVFCSILFYSIIILPILLYAIICYSVYSILSYSILFVQQTNPSVTKQHIIW